MSRPSDLSQNPKASQAELKSGKPWKNLGSRFFTALAMSIFCIIPLYFGGYIWAALSTLLGARMLWEWIRMSDPNPSLLNIAVPFLGLLMSVTYLLTGYTQLTILVVLVTAVLCLLLRLKRDGALWSAFGCFYILVPMLFIIWLRGDEIGFQSEGFRQLFYLIIVVVAADTFAYFGGSYFKGPKMAPKLSPNKSWSGFVSGVLGACVIGGFAGHYFGFGSVFGAILAVPVAVVSVFGDFLESGLKRKLGVKDSGGLLPGHGGLLDRLDSLIMVVFVFAIVIILIPGFWDMSL